MFEEGLIVMTVGMSTVFIFLIIMVITMHATYFILKNVVNKFFPEPVLVDTNTQKNDDTEIAVAISIAKLSK